MQLVFAALLAGLALGAPALAQCDNGYFTSLGKIMTKGGGTYSYGLTVGGESVMVGYLNGGPNGLPEVSFSLYTPYHIDIAGAGLAHLLAADATAAESDDTALTVGFSATSALPEASPGGSWQGKVSATVFAYGPDDYNRREIGTADLDGSYRFLDEISAEIEGCERRIIPVELELSYQGQIALKRRVLYFPDLGVSVITRWGPDADGPERKTGITGFSATD